MNYDALVGRNTEDGSPAPELATSWEMSADGLEWTYHLRKGVLWQDGKPFTASDVAFTYNYLKACGFTQWTTRIESIESAKAVDDSTVVIKCSRPKASMLYDWIPILPEHIWSKVPPAKAAMGVAPKPPYIGTGPFQYDSGKSDSFHKFVKNPSYWESGKPYVDEILWLPYTSADTMASDLKSGSLDYGLGLTVGTFKPLSSTPGITTNAGLWRSFDMLSFNTATLPTSTGNPVLKDEKFRQALSWAVDKQKLVDVAIGGYGEVAQGKITQDVPDYYWTPSPDEAFGFDLTKAGDLLTQAGYPLKDGVRVDQQGKPIKLSLITPAEVPRAVAAGKLIAGWFKELGIDVNLEVLEDAALFDEVFHYDAKGQPAPSYDMYIWSWPGMADPGYILGVHTTSQIGMWNDAYWSNATYDKLYEQQEQELDKEKRKSLTDQMSSIFYDSAPFVVYSYTKELEAYNTADWTGWTQIPSGVGLQIWQSSDQYANLRPVVAEASASSGSSMGTIVAVVVAVLVVAAIIVWVLLRKRRSREVEA
jgi:peptide/nickel transport system substrate-binding protein